MAKKTKLIKNYRVIIEPEIDSKTGKKVYTAFCPTLGVADWGRTVEETLVNIKEGIECYLESLIKHNEPVPLEDVEGQLITTTKVELYAPKGFCFA